MSREIRSLRSRLGDGGSPVAEPSAERSEVGGFTYRPDFLTIEDERELLEHIRRLEFSEVRMHGVVAKRRVVHYGFGYTYESRSIEAGPPFPEFLEPVRARAAEAAGVTSAGLAEALVTEYPPGAGIGWHRDAPAFGIVVAVSLGSACRFRFRRGREGRPEIVDFIVEPRSLYILAGPARREWQHSIPAAKELRYSITFRTLAARTRQGMRRIAPQ